MSNFFSSIPAELLKAHPETQLACIGPVTAKTLEQYGLTPHIQPENYTIPAMVDAVHAALQAKAGVQ